VSSVEHIAKLRANGDHRRADRWEELRRVEADSVAPRHDPGARDWRGIAKVMADAAVVVESARGRAALGLLAAVICA
jgi:hypothetical protein